MKGFHRIAPVLALLLAAPASAAADEVLRARGQEPSWELRIEGERLSFSAPGLGLSFAAPSTKREITDGRPRLVARSDEGELTVDVIERMCADSMSGMPFPIGVEVTFAGREFSGCGGEMMTAIEGGWRVIRMGDALLPEGVTMTIVFGTDGRVSGRSGCNRFAGAYTLSGEGLRFGDAAVTRMACEERVMEAERKFLDHLRRVTRVTPGENGQLALMAGDEAVLVLDRAD